MRLQGIQTLSLHLYNRLTAFLKSAHCGYSPAGYSTIYSLQLLFTELTELISSKFVTVFLAIPTTSSGDFAALSLF